MAKDKPPKGELITLTTTMQAGMVARHGMTIDQFPSTIPATGDGLIRRFNAMGQSSLEMERDGTVLLNLCDVMAYPREAMDEDTGEVSQFSWLVLLGSDGATWGTSSPVVAQKVAQIVALWSADLLPRPLAIQVVTRTARKSGQRYHDIVIVGES